MDKKIIATIIVGVFLVTTIGLVSANWFTDLFNGGDKPINKIDSLETMGVTDKVFNNKILEMDTTRICVKDGIKIVKNSKCEKDKPKYVWINISDTDYFKSNSQNLVRFKNEG